MTMEQLGKLVGRLRPLVRGQVIQDRLHLVLCHHPGRDQILDKLNQRHALLGLLPVFPLDGLQLGPQLATLRLQRVAQECFDLGTLPGLQLRLELAADLVDRQQARNREFVLRVPVYLGHI